MAAPRYIIVEKKDEVYIKIEADADLRKNLSDYFSFEVPGYRFTPQYRNRVWDGRIRLYSYATGQLYVGLYPYLKHWCKEQKVEIVKNTEIISIKEHTAAALDGLVNSYDIAIPPRSYQLDAFKYAVENERGLILSPTASGKSLISYMLCRYYLNKINNNILIIVPTTSLVEQMYHDFGDYSSKDTNFEVRFDCHKVYAGKEKFNVEPRVIISTWQSVHRLPKEWFNEYGMVIGDEAHNFKAKSLTSIMEKCVNARYRIGTTGTLDGTQTHQLVLEGLFGPVYKVTTSKELMDSGDLAQMDIDVILLKYKDEYCKVISKLKYQDELDFIVGYGPRNNFIANLALDQKGNTLILFNYVEKHGKPLHDLLKDKIDKKRKLFYVSGETHVDTREKIRSITEEENNAIIVASLGTFSTGINIKRLNNLIFASPSKSQIRVLQSIGRGLRVSPDGINTKVYDIADDLHWKAKKNYTLNHAAERIKIYSKEKFKYGIFEINI